MKKSRFVFVLSILMLVMLAGCGPGVIGQINTPVPTPQGGTPAPNSQINVPGVSIQINAPGPNPLENTTNANGFVAGVWLGLWHGIIAPVTLALSFFYPNVQMYEVYNDGSQYNLGFLLGVALFFVVLGAFFGSRRR
jgi:hypothetical protein